MVIVTESWNEQRMDDLNRRVEDGFARLDQRIDESIGRLDQRIDHLDTRISHLDTRISHLDTRISHLDIRIDESNRALRGEMHEGFAQLRGELAALQRTMFQVGGGLIGTVIAAAVLVVVS